MQDSYATNVVHTAFHLNASNPEFIGDHQAVLGEIVRTGKEVYSTVAAEFIHEKIHRSGQVRCIRAYKLKKLSRQPFMTQSEFTFMTLGDKCDKPVCDYCKYLQAAEAEPNNGRLGGISLPAAVATEPLPHTLIPWFHAS